MDKIISIGDICNTYGGLVIKESNGKYYWCIEAAESYEQIWEEIPKSLFVELVKFKKDCGANEKHN